jgi:hypothetical protein
VEDNFRSNSHNANKAREVREIEREKERKGDMKLLLLYLILTV